MPTALGRHTHANFIEWADRFFAVGKYDAGDKVLRQACSLPSQSLDDTNAFAQKLLSRGGYKDLSLFLGNVPVALRDAAYWRFAGEAAFQHGDARTAHHAYDTAIELEPDAVEAHLGRGVLYMAEGNGAQAIAALRDALNADPTHVVAARTLAKVRFLVGEITKAPELDDDWAFAFETGDLARAWPLYRERKFFNRPAVLKDKPEPQDLSDVAGRTICLYSEQGLGDVLQFARFAKDVAKVADKVILRCPTQLHAILGTLDADIAIEGKLSDPAEIEMALPLMSVPCLLDAGAQTNHAGEPYLRAPPNPRFSTPPDASGRLRVGIVWQGSRAAVDIGRSLPHGPLSKLLRHKAATFFSLQAGGGLDDIQGTELIRHLTIYPDLDAGTSAFLDSAALMTQLDLVVCTDTSVAHLAGALGVPTFLMLKHWPDWRWSMGKSWNWYQSMTMVHQPKHGDWNSVVSKVGEMIERKANEMGAQN
ncbi:MAG: tetratricopeptide repeat protein [Paracoccaceae bacterium]